MFQVQGVDIVFFRDFSGYVKEREGEGLDPGDQPQTSDAADAGHRDAEPYSCCRSRT